MPKYYVDKHDFKVIKTEEIKPYITQAKGLRTKVLIALAFLTGARVTELLRLRKGDFFPNYENGELRIRLITLKTYSWKRYRQAKINGEELIPPPRENLLDMNDDPFIKKLIMPFLDKLRRDDSKLFLRSKRWYQYRLEELNKQICGEDTKKYITFHYLRHSAITHIARDLRASTAEVMGWTGHRGSSFEVYIIPTAVERFKGKMGKR